jgi:hypothetical protein
LQEGLGGTSEAATEMLGHCRVRKALTVDLEHFGRLADFFEAGPLVQPNGFLVARKDLKIDPLEWPNCLSPICRVLDELLAKADLAVTTIDAHAEQASMLCKALGMGPKIDVADDLARCATDNP